MSNSVYSAASRLKNWVGHISARIQQGGEDRWAVSSDHGRVCIWKNKRLIDSIGWNEVVEIVASKRDMITREAISLAFRAGHLAQYKTVIAHEEMAGFNEIAAMVCETFPGVPSDWRVQLEASPVFSEPKLSFCVKDVSSASSTPGLGG
jgi:hypothetical protein